MIAIVVGCSGASGTGRDSSRTETSAWAPAGQEDRDEPAPRDPHGLAPLARRIVARVAALGERFPPMRGASPELRQIHSIDTSVLPWVERFEARWDHQHGVSSEPDPTYEPVPYSARSPYRSRLDPASGLRLTLWLYEGAWLQLVSVTPFEIGRLRVVTIVEAPNPELEAGVRGAVREILESERALLAR